MTGVTKAGPFELQLDPDRIVFKGDNLTDHATTIRINIKNTTDSRQAFKIKCTSADIFRVRPAVGLIKLGETVPVRITFTSREIPPSGKHFFMFYHKKTTEESHPRKVWTSTTTPDGMRKLLCYFETDDGRVACKQQYQKMEHQTRSEEVDGDSDEENDIKSQKIEEDQRPAGKEELNKSGNTPKTPEKEHVVTDQVKT